MRAHARRAAALLAVILIAVLAVVPPRAGAVPGADPIVVGIVLRESDPSFAVIEDPATSTTGFYVVGARVGSAHVKQILADRVILMTGEQQTLLRLATTVSTAPASAFSAPVPRADSPGPRRGASTSPGAGEPPPSPYGRIAAVSAPAGGATGSSATDAGGQSSPLGIAPQAGGPGGASGTQDGLSAALSLTGRMHGGQSVSGDEFSTTSLRDLLISMTYANVGEPHQQRLELYAPDGSLYQKFIGAVASSTQTLVPVGGTWITDHSLYGIWRIDVYVDRNTTPIATLSFTLTP